MPISATEADEARKVRRHSEQIDTILYIRFVLGEDAADGVDMTPIIQHVDAIVDRLPSLLMEVAPQMKQLPRIGFAWIAMKVFRVLRKCRTTCSELARGGKHWRIIPAFARALWALGSLALLSCHVAVRRPMAAPNCTLIPLARYLYR